MDTTLAQIEPTTPVPADQNPAAVYLMGLAASGRGSMHRKLRQAAKILGFEEGDLLAVPWAEMRFQHVAAVRAKLVGRDLAPATVNNVLAALKGVARAAFNLGQLSGDDLERIRNVKPVRAARLPSGRALTGKEIAALMDVCVSAGGAGGARDAALIATLYAAGLRRSEAVALMLEHYNQETGELVVRGKGDRERLLHINDGAADALADWLEYRGNLPGPLFCAVTHWGDVRLRHNMTDHALYNMLRKRAEQAGVEAFSPHDLRRSFVSDLLDAGADVVTVQKLAGHASVQTTARYDRRGEKSKREAIGLLSVPYQRQTEEVDPTDHANTEAE